MAKLPASIFNDVLGPVMRGPSSSHVAAAARIGKLIRQAHAGDIAKALVYFDPTGSLAESYDGHGSDIGLISGLLGMELTDPSVPLACGIAKEKGVDVQFIIKDYGAAHPNNYLMEVSGEHTAHQWNAISTGGGMISIDSFDGFAVSIEGGYYEYLLTIKDEASLSTATEQVKTAAKVWEEIITATKAGAALVNIKTSAPLSADVIKAFNAIPSVTDVITLTPILPTLSKADCTVPFRTAAELLEYSKIHKADFWELAVLYESTRGNTTKEAVFKQMDALLALMENCIEEGLAGTTYENRILGPQAHKMDTAKTKGTLVPGDLHNTIIKYITAIMEVKSSMGVIVAAPTAGSCGGLPGTLIGAGRTLGLPREEIVKGMLAAGLIGVFIAESATFAAEVAGCQVECGAGSGMGAAGLAQMTGGTVEQCIDAASMALQNITGLACDPVANRVEVPCLGKNIMCGLNAVACASMALAGFDKVVPLDETIAAIYDIGLKLPLELRCTLGGLGKTKTSFAIRKNLPE